MDSDSFKNLSERVHRHWLARLLRMHTTEGIGIDIWNDEFGIELKTALDRMKWSPAACQYPEYREMYPDKELYWAFMVYNMSIPVQEFHGKSLSRRITYREVWFMPWEWIETRPLTEPKTGPYRYTYRSSFQGDGLIDATAIPLPSWNSTFLLPTGSNLEKYVLGLLNGSLH